MPSPRWWPCSRAWFSALSPLCAWPVNPWCFTVSVLPPWCPRAESQRFSARCTCSFHCSRLAAHFCPLSLAVCALGCLMSRGDELRQLAAQLSVLAALEDSIALGLSRVMGLPVLVAPLSLPTLVHLRLPLFMQRPQRLRWCLRPVMRWRPLCCALRLSGLLPLGPALVPVLCAAAQTCSTCTASQFQRCLWPALDRSLSRSRDWLRAWLPRVAHRSRLPVAPFPRLSRSPRCLSRVAAIRRRLWTLCTLCSGLRGPSCHGVCVQLRRRMGRTPRRTRPRTCSPRGVLRLLLFPLTVSLFCGVATGRQRRLFSVLRILRRTQRATHTSRWPAAHLCRADTATVFGARPLRKTKKKAVKKQEDQSLSCYST